MGLSMYGGVAHGNVEIGGNTPNYGEIADTIVQRQAFLADNVVAGLSPYLRGVHEGVLLRKHQYPTIQELSDVMTGTRLQPDRRILWPSPPNAGKSTLSALVAKAAGIGNEAPDGRPLKGLLFVSRDNARTAALQTYSRLAPNIAVLPFMPKHGPEAIDKADMLVTTYHGFSFLEPEVYRYIGERIDFMALDEVHRGIGTVIATILKDIMGRYQPTTIGLSATSVYSKDRTVTDVLDMQYILSSMSPREAAQTGVANGVQLLAMHTGTQLILKSKRFSEQEISPLADDPERNKLIVGIAANMANLGHQGLTQCVPGIPASGSRHADQIAELAASRWIVDPRTGAHRLLRVESVGKHIKDTNKRIQAFRDGKLDGLSFTRIISESLDHPMGYLTAASPTGSAVEMGQFVGRGARFYEYITRIFWLCDILGTRAVYSLVTPFTIFDVDTASQLEVIGSSGHTRNLRPERRHNLAGSGAASNSKPEAKTDDAERLDRIYDLLDDQLVKALQAIPPGTTLEDMLVSKGTYIEPLPGYTEAVLHPAIATKRVTMQGATYRLRDQLGEDGKPLMIIVQGKGNVKTYISPEASGMLTQLFEFSQKITRIEMQNFLTEQGWPSLSGDGLFAICAAVGVDYEIAKRHTSFEPEAMRRLLTAISKIPLIDPEQEILVADLATVLGDVNSSVILNKLKSLSGAPFRQYLIERRRSRQPGAYQPVKAMTVEGAVRYVADRFKTSEKTRRHIGMSTPRQIVSAVQASHRQYMTDNGLGVSLSQKAIDQFIDSTLYSPDEVDDRPAIAAAPTIITSPDTQTTAASAISAAVPEAIPVAHVPAPDQLLTLPEDITVSVDTSYRSSGMDVWQRGMACNDPEVNLGWFITGPDLNPRRALRTCGECAVKGECLVAAIQQKVNGIAGGFTQEQREQLLPFLGQVAAWVGVDL